MRLFDQSCFVSQNVGQLRKCGWEKKYSDDEGVEMDNLQHGK